MPCTVAGSSAMTGQVVFGVRRMPLTRSMILLKSIGSPVHRRVVRRVFGHSRPRRAPVNVRPSRTTTTSGRSLMSASLNRTRQIAQTLLMALAFLVAIPARAQDAPAAAPPTAPDSDIDETAQADLYYRLGNMAAALPLYERLATQSPQNALFAERFA